MRLQPSMGFMVNAARAASIRGWRQFGPTRWSVSPCHRFAVRRFAARALGNEPSSGSVSVCGPIPRLLRRVLVRNTRCWLETPMSRLIDANRSYATAPDTNAMDTHDAIRARRAVKHFDPAFVMPAEHEALLIDLARQAPTSFNLQNWRAVNVKDPALRAELKAAAWNQAQVGDASLLFVFAADTRAHMRDPQRYWADAPKAAQDILVPMIEPFYAGRDWLARDEGMRSVGFAAQTMMLAAKSMGYDSCPMVGFDYDKVAQLVGLPDDFALAMMLAVGRGTKPAWAKPGYVPLSEVIATDRFAG